MNTLKTSMLALIALYCASSVFGQSLWDPRLAGPPLTADNRGGYVGDIVTIKVEEMQSVANQEDTKLEKQSSLDALISNFNLLPNFFGTLPQVTASAQKDFEGKAQYDKDGSFSTTISVIVIDTLPNGNLLLEGKRKILIDGETKLMKITGMVRKFDIGFDNVVSSKFIANAAISYEGEGLLTRTSNRGWFSRL